jgi:UDP-N-acetylglucosamine--N-acetylmuramyl-(pentapeptide) pyrophosphoryl-undecaprenol N-acetylglucosamine transferase
MTIAFTGGGTGGHFYPLIAIAEAVRDIARERRLIEPRLYYLAPSPFDEQALLEQGIVFQKIPAGKMRRYASWRNIVDPFITLWGYLACLVTLFRIYPDVLISKGGYASVPAVLAAKTLGIPIIVHESDSKPGRANLLASKLAARVAISFDDSIRYFPEKVRSKIARTGIPLRKEIAQLEPEGAVQELGLDPAVPTILIIGGSSGSERINETVLAALPELVSFANVIHQTGKANFTTVEGTSKVVLMKDAHAQRYHPFAYLSALSLRRAASAASLVVSRAGATAIAEISLWRRPAILIPIPEDVSHDQRLNAYSYARTGAAIVLEQANLTPHVLASEAKRVLSDPQLAAQMGQAGGSFSDNDAARLLAEAAIQFGLSHEDDAAPPAAPVPTTPAA